MRQLAAFGQFWRKFILGDDWRIAATVIGVLAVAAALVGKGVNAWYLLPVILMLGLGWSVRQAKSASRAKSTKTNRRLLSLLLNWFALWLSLVMISEVQVLGSYLKNASETSVQDLVLPVVLNLILATLVAAAFFYWFLRNRFRFYLSAIAVMILLSNGYESKLGGITAAVNNLLPMTVPSSIITLGYLALMVYLACLAAKWVSAQIVKRHWPTGEIAAGVVIMIAVVFFSQLIPVVRNVIAAWPQYFYQPSALAVAHPTAAQAVAKPDIYYILLEDYANQNVLKNQMNFDNSDFMNYLSGQGFYNVPGAYVNYPYTVNSVASTLAGNYLSDQVNKFSASSNQTMVPYFDTVRSSSVIKQLKSLGYSYDLLGDWYETSNYSPLADHNYTNTDQIIALNHTYSLNDFTDTLVQQNILWDIIRPGIKLGNYQLLGYNTQNDIGEVQSQLSQLKKIAAEPAGGKFVFSQILVPHNFFYFNADGSLNVNPTPDNSGESVVKKDTNEIQFINAQIQPIIDEIMKNSGGKANIILQSDEGPEPAIMNNTGSGAATVNKSQADMSEWSAADLKMKFGVLASYYIPGASQADLAQGADPVNIFRLLLNNDFSSNLPYLPLCYYGYPQGANESFVYQNINKALTGQSNSACPENGNLVHPGQTTLIKNPKTTATGDDD